MAAVDQPPRLGGRSVAMILSPLPAHQRKRHFQLFHGELIEEDDHDEEEDEEFVDLEDHSEATVEDQSEPKES